MKKIGLTGGIATGKSTVLRIIREMGYRVLSSDEIARSITKKGEKGYEKVVEVFGSGILDDSGEIDRKKLAKMIFSDPEKKKLLEGILHPLIREEVDKKIAEIESKSPCSLVFVEVPLLFEVKAEDRFDFIVVVYIPRQLQIKRLMERDNLTRGEAELRIKNQIDIEVKRKKAHFVIDNSGTIEDTRKLVVELVEKISSIL
ncbi:MAG: dephospho-CoA kinase [Thermosulfidibacteraceae bacterium]|jgi:dephospho-CoA kinase